MTEDLIDCYRDCETLMPFLHLPIQSGSNKILKLMNRKHDRKYYMSVVEKLNKANKNIKISSDFIVGYPGETEKDFEDTMELVEKIGFVNSYSFIFSPRPGTPANEKKLNNIEESEKRLRKLQNILENFQLENNKIYLQQYCEVLIENKCEEHFEHINTKAVELALKARDISKKNILVAGGLPNQYQTYSENLGDNLNLIEKNFYDQAKLLKSKIDYFY